MRSSFGEDGGSALDISGMIAWAQRTGRTLGDITGENFSSAMSQWTQDLYKRNDLMSAVKYKVNSQSDYEYLKAQGYDFHATGGYEYGKGIVAEAGPELLEVINGGVRITPLTPSAKNTPVGAGSSTVNNYYYNTVHADVSSRYDVYGMAEDLATAEKWNQQGKGR